MIVKKVTIILLLATLFLLTACSTISDDNTGDAAVEERTTDTADGADENDYEGQTGAYNDPAMTGGSAIAGESAGIDALSDPNSPLSVRTIYFDYDSTMINSQGQSALNAHAEYLSLNPQKILIVEGHTDERGTREYNLALGERRSKAIADFLSISGVPVQQMDIRSYGEENPAALGHDESAWQLNRRVELLY